MQTENPTKQKSRYNNIMFNVHVDNESDLQKLFTVSWHRNLEEGRKENYFYLRILESFDNVLNGCHSTCINLFICNLT